MTKLIRISDTAYKKLCSLEIEMGDSKQRIIQNALEKIARENLLRKANQAYEALKSDASAWAEELEERKELEGTLGDGLEDL
jgi:hypothetical protein